METADVVWMPLKAAVPWACARAAVVEAGTGAFALPVPRRVLVNGEDRGLTDRVAVYVEGLEPGARNAVRLEPVDGSVPWEAVVETPPESVRLDVRDFGAAGDGRRDDTGSIQAAVSCCPGRGTVEVPAGRYRVSSLWLKDGVSLHLAEGAVLEAVYDREGRAYLPDTRRRTDTGAPYPLGTWEGEGCPMFCAVVNAVGVSDACVYGPGAVDGRATPDTWWHDPKTIRVAARPRLVFLEGCEGVTVAGCTLRNSPSWNVHPVLSRDVRFLCLTLEGPADSPNTDGVNPESCTGVLVLGCEFSVGDDCIAVKSGKLSRERALRPACTGVLVRHCSMHDGHGAVVVGSESAGGVSDVLVEDCVFARTDRGLRVKTRRGRGRDSLVGGVVFRRIAMEGVGVPFVVNAFYNCDKDGMEGWVQDRSALPVDMGTPRMGDFTFEDISAAGSRWCAAWVAGLPEEPVGRLTFRRVDVAFAEDPDPGVPAMAGGVGQVARGGFVVSGVRDLVLEDVRLSGVDGEPLVVDGEPREIPPETCPAAPAPPAPASHPAPAPPAPERG